MAALGTLFLLFGKAGSVLTLALRHPSRKTLQGWEDRPESEGD